MSCDCRIDAVRQPRRSACQSICFQAQEILRVINALGLEPYTPPEPLPEITPEDVHAVCWLALS